MLNYRRFGTGPTVVLQHGYAGGGGYWSVLAAHLAANFDVIATDMPAFAGSADEPVPDSITGIAESLLDTLTQLSVNKLSKGSLTEESQSDVSTHPDCSYELWHGIPGAQLCVLPNCAHNAHLELSEAFNPIISRFLRAP